VTREWFASAPRAPELDLEQYAYDAPWTRPERAEPEPASEANAGAYALSDEDFEDDASWDPYGAEDEDDDDALFAALEEALDEVEAEARLAAVKAAAAPEEDSWATLPGAGTAYRAAISTFLAQGRPRAPRYSQVGVRGAGRDGALDVLLQESLQRARSSLDRWRVKGWASDLPARCTVTP
jgi:hypothetical protein